MSDLKPATAGRTLPVPRTRSALIALWSAQVLLGAMFLLSGGSKLAGAAAMVAPFDAIGVGQRVGTPRPVGASAAATAVSTSPTASTRTHDGNRY
jgi:hypothetical protein